MKQIMAILTVALYLLFSLPASAATAPPPIPEGALVPLEVQLPKGRKLPVYTGPGEDYALAGKGRAMVSTNGWVQVFGREGDWLLIQYGIKEGQMRFGYIAMEGLLVESTITMNLSSQWQDASYALWEPVSLTDDPLGSQGEVALLPQRTHLRLLGRMGPWAYVQAQAGESLLRGFVTEEALADSGREEAGSFDLRAISWGPLVPDHALTRYFMDDIMPTVWLRLDSRENRTDLQALSNFRVVSGRASCRSELVPLSSIDSVTEDWTMLHFRPQDGFNRGALEIALEPGESVENLTIACTRTKRDGGREVITLPLAGVPQDSGYPSGGAAFAALRYTPFAPSREQLADHQRNTGRHPTLGDVLMSVAQAMPQAPAQTLALPWDTPDYRLYLLEGRIAKQHGSFGVYDILFGLEDPPEGGWVAAYQECDACNEIDSFDMLADGVLLPGGLSDSHIGEWERLPETLEGDFALLMLVRTGGRSAAEIDRLVKGLALTATFSAEKWNICYEQHGTTSAIGPRSQEPVDMSGISLGKGILSQIP